MYTTAKDKYAYAYSVNPGKVAYAQHFDNAAVARAIEEQRQAERNRRRAMNEKFEKIRFHARRGMSKKRLVEHWGEEAVGMALEAESLPTPKAA